VDREPQIKCICEDVRDDVRSPQSLLWRCRNGLCSRPSNGHAACEASPARRAARSRAQVQEVHAVALAAGGSDEGAPGPRGDSDGPYCEYFRDPEGNKFLVYRNGPDEAWPSGIAVDRATGFSDSAAAAQPLNPNSVAPAAFHGRHPLRRRSIGRTSSLQGLSTRRRA
jgi:hypothetical protein